MSLVISGGARTQNRETLKYRPKKIPAMTKRCYPFPDCAYQQLKHHASEKIMKMKAISILHNINLVPDQLKFTTLQRKTCNQQAMYNYKQLHINNNGQLSTENGFNLQLTDLCISCRNKLIANHSSTCDFCVKRMCDKCAQLCICCSGNFCQLCSLISYDQPLESVTCLSCLH
uniref:Apoptosis regulatory protein Siva n=1 Tax=Strigamia maritima TaxID=126957 RepID=T1J610_STRMM